MGCGFLLSFHQQATIMPLEWKGESKDIPGLTGPKLWYVVACARWTLQNPVLESHFSFLMSAESLGSVVIYLFMNILCAFCSTMAVNLSNIKVREWFQRQRDSIQPWSEFLNSKKFRPPKSVALGGKRILKNVASFQSNYTFVFLGLLIFCLYVPLSSSFKF